MFTCGPMLLAGKVSYNNTVIADGAAAYWTFDNVLTSSVGSLTWAYQSGTALTYVAPLITYGNAANFSSTNSYYNTPYSTTFNTLTFTIEIWVKFTSTSNVVIFECNGNTGFSLQVAFDSSGRLQLNIGGSSSALFSSAVNDGNRHHVVFVCQPTAQKTYVDGSLVNSYTFTLSNNLNTQPLYLASRAGAVGYTGTVDELAFYTSALTATQISNHYLIGTS